MWAENFRANKVLVQDFSQKMPTLPNIHTIRKLMGLNNRVIKLNHICNDTLVPFKIIHKRQNLNTGNS